MNVPEPMFSDHDAVVLNEVLSEAQAVVSKINFANGWHDRDRSFGDDIALLHSEVSEALEAFRSEGIRSWTTDKGKPEGVGSELADVLVRLLDTCSRYDINLAAEFIRKCEFNATRGYRHGGKQL